MSHRPSRSTPVAFPAARNRTRRTSAGRPVRGIEVPADCETPVSAYLKLRDLGAVFLLESVEQGENLGRYSFIGLEPKARLVLTERALEIHSRAGRRLIPHDLDPIETLRRYLATYAVPPLPDLPGLCGGAVGYLSYDLIRSLERLPRTARRDLDLPLGVFFLTGTLVVFDHVRRTLRIIVLPSGPEGDSTALDPEETIRVILDAMARPLPDNPCSTASSPACHSEPHPQGGRGISSKGRDPSSLARLAPRDDKGIRSSTHERPAFERSVRRALEHIRAGDIFQVVLSRRIAGTTSADPFQAYRALRIINPSPYMVYFDAGDFQLIASSPEALVKLSQGTATVRPIAGTRPRGTTPAEDHALQKELLADEKERAEHVMLVDLGRNDLGRVCDYGTVKTTQFMAIERYSHVMHLVSNVEGRLSPGRDMFDLLRATFPAGTVTGAPKIRAMEIIEDLEGLRRDHYAGVMGYFGFSGDMDMCITIRTILMRRGRYILQAGAGIVADSDPRREYEETEHKIAALQAAIRMAEQGFGSNANRSGRTLTWNGPFST